jgi:hypothetical protein
MGKSRHRPQQKKKAAARTQQMIAKRKQVAKLVAELEEEFTKLQAPQGSAIESFYQPPLLSLTPTK